MLNIALIAPMCAGKSHLAHALVDLLGYRRLAFATPLKERVAGRHGITIAQLDTNKDAYRAELQTAGQAEREREPLFWCWELGKQIAAERERPIVVDDCRYLNEAEYLRELGFILVKLRTPLHVRIARHVAQHGTPPKAASQKHASELDFGKIKAHITVSGLSHPANNIGKIISASRAISMAQSFDRLVRAGGLA